MMKYPATLLLLCVTLTSSGQLRTRLNVEYGPQWSVIKEVDPGNYFTGAAVFGTHAGLMLSQEVSGNLFVTTGIYYQPYSDGINMIDNRRSQAGWKAFTSYQVPLQLEYRIPLFQSPVSISPHAGYVFGFMKKPPDPYRAEGILSAPDGSAFTYSLEQTFQNTYLHLLETGVGLSYQLPFFWEISLNFSYLKGFSTGYETMVDYTDQDNNTYTAVYASTGSSYFTALALHIPVSNLWQYKDYRTRARIERSLRRGKSTDRGMIIYFGAEAGSLWRIFHHSNPAIAPRPMQGRGLFRYANLHTGGYAGIMFNDNLGLDAGVYYQRSNSFFAVMYDHEVDFTYRIAAPAYLEFPVRVRYLYDLYKHKIYVGAYAGLSVLASLTSGEHGAGGGEFTYLSPVTGNPETATFLFTASRVSPLGGALRTGIGAEYNLPVRFPLIATCYLNYLQGFLPVNEIRINGSIPETPSENTIVYSGGGWSLDIGLKIPFRLDDKGKNNCGKLPRVR